MRKRILIAQSSETMSPVIREALDNGPFDLRYLSGLTDVVATALEQKPDLVLFDISCWHRPVEQLLLELMDAPNVRSTRKVILSDSAGPDDKITALDSGADDFLLKPISPRELTVRIAATLRAQAVICPTEDIHTLGRLSLYPDVMEVSIEAGAERKKLSPKEFELLDYLMDNPGRVFSREELLERVWVPWEIDAQRVVDVYICRLREKIEDDPSQPRRLLTRRGQGYLLVDPADSRA
jgi:two-component system response regulator VicR